MDLITEMLKCYLLRKKGNKMADVRKTRMDIIDKAETIANIIAKGKDVELRKTPNGISVCEVSKRVVSR